MRMTRWISEQFLTNFARMKFFERTESSLKFILSFIPQKKVTRRPGTGRLDGRAFVNRTSLILGTTAFFLSCAVVCTALFADQCTPLSESTKRAIIFYLSKRLKILDSTSLTLGKEELVRDTCYRKLTLEGGSLRQPVTFFLAPDQRFVSPVVFDTAFDPESEEKEEAEQTKKLLLLEDSPSRGDASASITIVEFSDFECPYCRRFNEWMQTLPGEAKARIRLVYKHFPLAIHSWANDAAAMTACASLQSPSAFWLLHDFIFQEQAVLNATNIRDKIAEFAASTPPINAKGLLTCIEQHKADGIIARDIELASQLHVTGTPTIFANGLRLRPLQSIEDLKAAIAHTSAKP